MINGAHVILYSTDADADRAFFSDTLKYRHADAGHGWLIFALPPAEIALHPADGEGKHELYLMCEDVDAFVADMKKKKVPTGAISEQRWGRLTEITLPSGGRLGVYEPRHASPVVKKKSAAKAKAKPKKAARKR